MGGFLDPITTTNIHFDAEKNSAVLKKFQYRNTMMFYKCRFRYNISLI